MTKGRSWTRTGAGPTMSPARRQRTGWGLCLSDSSVTNVANPLKVAWVCGFRKGSPGPGTALRPRSQLLLTVWLLALWPHCPAALTATSRLHASGSLPANFLDGHPLASPTAVEVGEEGGRPLAPHMREGQREGRAASQRAGNTIPRRKDCQGKSKQGCVRHARQEVPVAPPREACRWQGARAERPLGKCPSQPR